MAVNLTIKIDGLNELRERFKRVPSVVGPELERATKKAGAVLLGTSKKESPVRTGTLRRSINMEYKPIQVSVFTNLVYAVPVHEGYRAHTIYPRRAKALRFKTRGGEIVYVKRANIPRFRGNPFMKRAVQKEENRINKIFSEALNSITQKI